MRHYKFALAALALLVLAGGGWFAFSSSQPSYQTAVVTRAPIVAEALANGHVETPVTGALRFAASGKLVALTVSTGQRVTAGTVLARQDSSVLAAQLRQAQAAVATAEADLSSLEAGTRPEQLAVTNAQVESDQTALSHTNQTLRNAMENAYTVADSAVQSDIDPLFNNSHASSPQVKFVLADSQLESRLENGRATIGPVLAAWSTVNATLASASDFGKAQAQAGQGLSATAALLADASAALDRALPSDSVSAAQITTWASGVAAARTSVSDAQSTLTAAESAAAAASSALTKDQKTLALEQAGSSASSVAAQQATVAQAQANVEAIEAQMRELEIVAPFAGTVTDTHGAVGENVSPDMTIVSLMPSVALEVKANVSEDNIVGVKVGDPVRITLDAFPANTTFSGMVGAIDPSQTELSGAVYYQTTILFDKTYQDILPGMTANVWITTASSTDALQVPASAVSVTSSSTTANVVRKGSVVAVPVVAGIQSQNGMVQILSGLSEGDRVVVGP